MEGPERFLRALHRKGAPNILHRAPPNLRQPLLPVPEANVIPLAPSAQLMRNIKEKFVRIYVNCVKNANIFEKRMQKLFSI